MAEKKFFVDVNLQGNNINNLKADTLDITSNLASANTKRIVYWSGQYYYSDGTSWIALGNTESLPAGGATGDILAKASGTDYDVEWISNYTSTVQHEVKAGVALTKGQAVYVSSANGTNMIVSKASNASESTSSKTMGLAASTAALNGIIFVITEGLLTGTGGTPLDTSTATEGDPVWLGTNGNLIFGLTNKPVAPAHLVFLGIVTRSSATVGEIFVKVQNGFELGELHNVDALNPSNNDGLFYNTTTSLWEHKSIATALGYTPENVANKSTDVSLGTSDTLYPTQNAVKVYTDNILGNSNALVYKGTIDCSTNPDYPTADAGWMYIASVAGKIGGASGTDVEVGDMIICNTDGTVSGNQATVGQYWNVIQKNIVGAVTGPASSVNNTVAVFDGTTGKVIKQGIITDTGTNVGIGTTTPNYKLEVSEDILVNGARIGLGGGSSATNIVLGLGALQSNTTGVRNVAIGYNALTSQTSSGNYNVAIGYQTLALNSSGQGSIAIGDTALKSNTTGTINTAIGTSALNANTTGIYNTAIGYNSLKLNTTFGYNIGIGGFTLENSNGGTQNIAIGHQSLQTLTTGSNNTGIGYRSGYLMTTGNNNFALGPSSLYNTTTGSTNIGAGTNALFNNITGSNNSAIGSNALFSNSAGDNNTALGIEAGYNLTGSSNVVIGYQAGKFITDGTTANTTPNQSIYIGIGSKALTATDTNEIVIGYNAIGNGSNTTTIGLQGTTTQTLLAGSLKINNAYTLPSADGAANYVLTTNGSGVVSWSGLLIPNLTGNEIWRGSTYRNNSTTVDTTSGLTVTPTGTPTARAVATTSYATRSIRLGITAAITATGRYSGVRGSALLWYVTGGFLYTGEFNISDTATAVGTHNFWGLASSTSDLVIGGVSNDQPSALLNIIAFANDSGDANLQIMHNDASGTATKTDLGASFPSNRTAGAAITTIYSCYLYNAPASSNVIYRIVNKETGVVAQGTLSTNLPASTVGLNFFGARTMGTSGGGINNSGQFDVYRLGVYSL